MAGLTKAQRAAKAEAEARAKALEAAGLTEEQFAALSADEQAALIKANARDGGDEGEEIAFVTMTRDAELYNEPHTAQVHPDEVENYRPGGWEIA
jgi:hypothetical protein